MNPSKDRVATMCSMGCSPLELLIKPIFYQVCSYLSRHEKCRSIPILSHAMNKLFDPSRCCSDPLSINLLTDEQVGHFKPTLYTDSKAYRMILLRTLAGTLPFIHCTSKLSIIFNAQPLSSVSGGIKHFVKQSINHDISFPHIDLAWLTREIKAALLSGSMTSLSITEPRDMMLLRSLTPSFGVSTVRLEHLSINLLWNRKFGLVSRKTDVWGCLTECVSLKRFSIDVKYDMSRVFEPFEIFDPLFRALPDSIEELVCLYERGGIWSEEDSEQTTFWHNIFSSVDILPNLTSLDFGSNEDAWYDVVPDLGLTVMRQTNKIRPICLVRYPADLMPIMPLPITHLTFFGRSEFVELLSNYDQSINQPINPTHNQTFKRLQHLDILFLPTDRLASMCAFASHHSLTYLDIHIHSDRGQHNLIDDESMKALGSISSLQHLTIRGATLSSNPNVGALMSSGWPRLLRLTLDDCVFTEEQLDSLLTLAAPIVETVEMFRSSLDPFLSLAIVLHRCSRVVNVFISDDYDGHHADDLRDMFEQYPANGLHYLQSIKMDLGARSSGLCPGARHYLMTQIMHAPRLTHVDMNLIIDNVLMSACVLRSMTKLSDESILSSVLRTGVKLLDADDLSRFVVGVKGDEVGFVITGTDYDRLSGSEDRCCGPALTPRFRPHVSDQEVPGESSRRAYFDALTAKLTDRQKRSLAAWESGDYSECCTYTSFSEFAAGLLPSSSP